MLGFDVGTYNLIVSRRGENNEVKCRRQVNAFLEIPLDNRYTFNMLKRSGVDLFERKDMAYVVGEDAVNMAYTLNIPLHRPMRDGCLNPGEKDAFRILQIMIHSMIGEIATDNDICYYSVPANAVNQDTDAEYHQQVLDSIFKSYKVNEKRLHPYPINEGLSLVFAELGQKHYTGLGVSYGAGLANFCYAIYSQPVFTASLAHSGDWVDQQAAKATGESSTFINKEKTKIDLRKPPTNMIERAIIGQYKILIEKSILQMKRAFLEAGNKVRTETPLDVVLGGGTASPPGFEELFQETIKQADFPLQLGEIIKPKDHLYSVSRGCLIAAENAN